MRKLSTALATVGLASTALIGLASTPASANPPCAPTRGDSTYSIDISPGSQTVRKGSNVTFTGTAHRRTTKCAGHVVSMQYAKPGRSFVQYRRG